MLSADQQLGTAAIVPQAQVLLSAHSQMHPTLILQPSATGGPIHTCIHTWQRQCMLCMQTALRDALHHCNPERLLLGGFYYEWDFISEHFHRFRHFLCFCHSTVSPCPPEPPCTSNIYTKDTFALKKSNNNTLYWHRIRAT